MICPECKSSRVYGPHYACDIVDRAPRAYMTCANCWNVFDAYTDYGWLIELHTMASVA